MSYRNFIESVLQEASIIANQRFGKVKGTAKPDNTVLTETDIEIGRLILDRIEQVYKNHNVIDEEAGVLDKQSRFTWVVDPIDGTANFALGIPLYGTMLGLLENDSPIAGGIALPYFTEIYIAEKGWGGYCNGIELAVSGETDLSEVLVAYGVDGHPEDPDITKEEMPLLAEIILRVRNLRTSNSVFDALMVANGKYGAVLNRTSKIWDNVAQQIIVEEAGGVYTDFFGKPIDYSNPLSKSGLNYTFCAGSPILHKQLQNLINRG